MTTGMESKEKLEHDVKEWVSYVDKIVILCTCGAIWSHKPSETIEEINATMEAHRKYFNKPKTLVL